MEAYIERGKVIFANNGLYSVASYDRDGIAADKISATDETVYEIGDNVYFFLFRDGTGKILCRM